MILRQEADLAVIEISKTMCENCKEIILRDSFYSSIDYMNCLEYIQELIEAGRYILVNKTCDLDKVRDENGHWNGDVFEHVVQCTQCEKQYLCFPDTYHGSGSFRESRGRDVEQN